MDKNEIIIKEENKTNTDTNTKKFDKMDPNNFDNILTQNVTYLLNLDKTKDIEAIGHFTNEYLKMGGNYNSVYILN